MPAPLLFLRYLLSEAPQFSSMLFVVTGSGTCRCGFAGFPRAVFLFVVVKHFLRSAEADFHGPCDHGDSPVTRGYGG